jgi:hypothetical protein
MRATRLLFLGLVALSLVVPVGCRVAVCQPAQPPRPAPKAREGAKSRRLVPVPKGVGAALVQALPKDGIPDAAAFKAAQSWEVKGWGRNREEAEEDALKRAHPLVVAHLRRQERPLTWTPSVRYIRDHLVSGPPTRHKDDDEHVGGIDADTECWSLAVELTPARYQAMIRQDRAYQARQRTADREGRAERRIVLAAKVMAGLLIVLVALTGFLRLDDRAGGAYTRRLGSGLRCLLSAPGAGLRSLAGKGRPQS